MICENVLKDIATPLPITVATGNRVQNAAFRLLRNKALAKECAAKKKGHATAHTRRTPPVPIRCWRGGKTRRSHNAWETPLRAMAAAISSGWKPTPPRLTGVYKKTGSAAVNANASNAIKVDMKSTRATPGYLINSQIDIRVSAESLLLRWICRVYTRVSLGEYFSTHNAYLSKENSCNHCSNEPHERNDEAW